MIGSAAGAIELIDEPQPLLRIRERQRLLAPNAQQRRRSGPGADCFGGPLQAQQQELAFARFQIIDSVERGRHGEKYLIVTVRFSRSETSALVPTIARSRPRTDWRV